MLTIVVVIAVLGILFGAAALATYEGNVLNDPLPDDRDARLPDSALQPEDVAELRFDMAVRGYRMAQVDTVLSRLAAELAARDARIAQLERALADGLEPAVTEAERWAQPQPAPLSRFAPLEPYGSPAVAAVAAEEPAEFDNDADVEVLPEPEPEPEPEPDLVPEPAAAIASEPDPQPEPTVPAPLGSLTGTDWWTSSSEPVTAPEPLADPEPAPAAPVTSWDPVASWTPNGVPDAPAGAETSAPYAFAFPELHPPEPEVTTGTAEPTESAAPPPDDLAHLSEADRWWAQAQAAEPPH